MHTAYWNKSDFSVVMSLSRQVDSLSIASAQDNAIFFHQTVPAYLFACWVIMHAFFVINP